MKIRLQKMQKQRYVSAIVLHELFKYAISKEGRENAKIKVTKVKQDFQIVPVDDQITQVSAELRYKYPFADGRQYDSRDKIYDKSNMHYRRSTLQAD